MKGIFKFVLLPVLLVSIGFGYVYLNKSISYDSTQESIEYIYEHFNSAGKLVDIFNDIGVKDVSDIRLYVDDEEISIRYGTINLTWKIEDFVKQDNLKSLERIGIRAFKDKTTGKIRVFWFSEEVERWVH